MTVGMTYEMDCRDLMLCRRYLAWVCEEALSAASAASEMAAAAAAAAAGPETVPADTEMEPVQTPEDAAFAVLQKNLGIDSGGVPEDGNHFFTGPVRWQLFQTVDRFCLELDCGYGDTRLSFLQSAAPLRISAEMAAAGDILQ